MMEDTETPTPASTEYPSMLTLCTCSSASVKMFPSWNNRASRATGRMGSTLQYKRRSPGVRASTGLREPPIASMSVGCSPCTSDRICKYPLCTFERHPAPSDITAPACTASDARSSARNTNHGTSHRPADTVFLPSAARDMAADTNPVNSAASLVGGRRDISAVGSAKALVSWMVTTGANAAVTPSTVSTRMCSSANSTIKAMPACSTAKGVAPRAT
mmetsp:Transcript_10159/g.19181  ORF Transcript_10159/g.19181 Transcript_10159/m.19181 type:complete len:217 (-) Transcript_10159:536-1186(-)